MRLCSFIVIERGGGFCFDVVVIIVEFWLFVLFWSICNIFDFVVCIFWCLIDFGLSDWEWLMFLLGWFELDEENEDVLEEFLKILGYFSFSFLKWFWVCCNIFLWVKIFFLNMMFFWKLFRFCDGKLIIFFDNLFELLCIEGKLGFFFFVK